jgi:hypothetical protein
VGERDLLRDEPAQAEAGRPGVAGLAAERLEQRRQTVGRDHPK